MKKVLQLCSLVLALLTGCSSNQIGMDSLDLQHEDNIQSFNLPVHFTGKNDMLYFQNKNGQLYYFDKDLNCIDLGSLSYIDDKKVTTETLNKGAKKYFDQCISNLYFYDSKIYFVSMRDTIEGDITYILSSIDEKGDSKKELMSINYYPTSFIIQKGYIIMKEDDEDTQQSIIHVYNQQLKEEKVIKPDGYVYRLFAEGSHVYLVGGAFDGEKNGTLILHLDDLSTESIFLNGNREYYLFFRDNTYATRSLDKSVDEVDNPSEITYYSTIYDRKTNEPLFEVTNELIGYYDDNYIYTTVLNTPNTKYRVYDKNYQLVKEINPSDSIQSESNIDVIFSKQDFDYIYRVFNNYIITSLIENDISKIVACSIESGRCKVVVDV